MEDRVGKKKGRRRVNVDREIWQQLTRRENQALNFSRLVSALLESYLARSKRLKHRVGDKVSVDITIDDSLWKDALRTARNQGFSLSHILRELLREHAIRRSMRSAIDHERKRYKRP